ncbi:MAG: hypothetical protein QMC67_04910 [Candidatus Wallbacteria bacterium]
MDANINDISKLKTAGSDCGTVQGLPEIKPLIAYSSDYIYLIFSYFTKHDPIYAGLFYFFVSYCMVYAFGLVTGQFFGGNGLNPMPSYIVDNICMGLLAAIGAGLMTNLYVKIKETSETLYKKSIIKTEDYDKYNNLLREFELKYNRNFIHWLSFILSTVLTIYVFFQRTGGWLGVRGGITGYYDAIFIFINFAVITVVVYKCIITLWFLQKVLQFDIKVQPMHPDHSGGLKSLGSLAMAVNYFLIIVTFYFTILMIFDKFSQQFTIFYMFFYAFTFFAFFASLYKAHIKMKNVKNEALAILENTSNYYYNKLKSNSSVSKIYDVDSADEIVLIDNLYTIVEKMPVWPLNIHNIIKFFSAFITPFILFMISLLSSTDSVIYHLDDIFKLIKK